MATQHRTCAEGPPLPEISTLISRAARANPERPALVVDRGTDELPPEVVRWDALDRRCRRVARALGNTGVVAGDRVGIATGSCAAAVEVLLGALGAGACAVPLPSLVTHDSLARMIDDARLRLLLTSGGPAAPDQPQPVIGPPRGPWRDYRRWLDERAPIAVAPIDSQPDPQSPDDAPFNIIYSSGTTSEPRGIVHSRRMRALQIARMGRLGLDDNRGRGHVTLLSTPLGSNATLIALLPTLAFGGTVVLLPRFDPQRFVEQSLRWRVTATMMVPTQYQRILAEPRLLERLDRSSFQLGLCTGAPLPAATKAALLAGWPGRLVEIYGQTEGGCTTMLDLAAHPDKLETVGRPAAGVEVRIVDDDGDPLAQGAVGEIVGRAATMMTGYQGRRDLTEQLTWRDPDRRAFYRTGDLGWLDGDGFLHLAGRRKDLIISGGLNIYPDDLERVIVEHPDVAEVAVIGVPCPRRGEAPLAVVVPRAGAAIDREALVAWANSQLGKAQRLAGVTLRDSPLPRNGLGKVLKRELRRGPA